MKARLLNIAKEIVDYKPSVLWWYLIAISSTIGFKYFYLESIYRGGVPFIIENYTINPSFFETLQLYSLLFLRDFGEVAILLLGFYLVGHKLLRINTSYVIVSSILFIFLIETANLLSVWTVKSLLTYDTLMTTIGWVQSNPDILGNYVRKRNMAFLLLLILIAFVPAIISKASRYTKKIRIIHSILFSSIILFVSISLSLYFFIGGFLRDGVNMHPVKGYWSSIIYTLVGDDIQNPLKRDISDQDKMKSDYRRLIYPGYTDAYKENSIELTNLGKKHILIVSLETTPKKYYSIINNPELPNFFKMSQHSLISNMHFAASPYTAHATYSILSGTYVPHKGVPIQFGQINVDSLANVLAKSGYQSLYIDSSIIDWHPGKRHHRIVESLGFYNTFERTDYDYDTLSKAFKDPFDAAVYAESTSIDKAIEHIRDSHSKGKKSLVFLDTILGHYKWKSKNEDVNISESVKLEKLAEQYDLLMGRVLDFLQSHNLEDEVIIVVTGDHGLRYYDEYNSLGEMPGDIEVEYNVPFMLYAPGIFGTQYELNHVTSHVDIAPTLLFLVGENDPSQFFHGDIMLNSFLENRIVFMMNHDLKSVNSFHWKGVFFSYNDLTQETNSYIYEKSIFDKKRVGLEGELKSAVVLDKARSHFSDAVAMFMKRKF